ncbi:MAG: glycosyltransferase family 4 protein [Betaproteobacteria bacterium]
MNEPRIIFITPGCFDKGGISRYCRYQIQALRSIFGNENVRIFSLMGPDNHAFEEPLSVYWHGRESQANNADRIKMSAMLLNEALNWRPSIIHSAHVNFGPLVKILAKICGATTVLNVYGVEIWSGLSKFRQQSMFTHDHIIADCHATADYVRTNSMHPNAPSVIWDCVDLDRFRPGDVDRSLIERYGLPDPSLHPIVMSLGRLSVNARHKGFDRLISSFATLLPKFPNARLVISGAGDDKKNLERLAQDKGISQEVVFTGGVDEADLAKIYRYADVFSLVSDFGFGRGEGIPLTPLEAMACGVPVIVGNEDGSREAVDGDRNGLIVSPRDQSALTNALLTILSERSSRRRQEARAVAEERFGYKAFEQKHYSLYTKILDR